MVFCLQCYMDIYVGVLSHLSCLALLFSFNLVLILPLSVFYGRPRAKNVAYSCVAFFYVVVFCVYYLRTFVLGQHVITPDDYAFAAAKTVSYLAVYAAIIAEAFKMDIAVNFGDHGKDSMR